LATFFFLSNTRPLKKIKEELEMENKTTLFYFIYYGIYINKLSHIYNLNVSLA